MSITSIECLSNEFFYEIFEYLDPWDISDAFSNLNYRFEQLLDNSSVLYKIKLIDRTMSKDILTKNWMKILHFNRKQIFSIHLCMSMLINQLASLVFINSSLHRLQSLVLIESESNILMAILEELINFPRLYSLTIKELRGLTDLTDVYQLILALPTLTYYKISTMCCNASVSLPISTEPSPLQYLIIYDPCHFNELSRILSYTPQLRHLDFTESRNIEATIKMIIPWISMHLTYLGIHVCCVTFDEFEIFLRQSCSNLKVLKFGTSSEEVAYMDGYRWERLIVQDYHNWKNSFSNIMKELLTKISLTFILEKKIPSYHHFGWNGNGCLKLKSALNISSIQSDHTRKDGMKNRMWTIQ
jgi:hypothetical protein